ncbi:MAG: S8 family serine peptidase [Bacteroidota bacterium]
MVNSLLFHGIGIGLAAIAFWMFGRGIVRKERATRSTLIPTFVLMVAAIVYQFVYPEPRFFNRIGHLFVDLGAGMFLASFYLAFQKARYKMFRVPGVMGIIFGLLIYGVTFLSTNVFLSFKDRSDTVQLLVELGPDDDISEVESILKKYNAVYEKAFPNVDLDEDKDLAQYFLVFVDEAKSEPLMIELSADYENVDQVAPNGEVKFYDPIVSDVDAQRPGQYLADDPYLQNQWYANSLQYNKVYKWLQDKKPRKKAKVAIVDTGVDRDHEDLESNYEESGGEGDYDLHSHGTHCAGLAGSTTNNGKGVGSLNWDGAYITISGFPALDDQGRGTDHRVAKAIIDAAESGADVISMSLGGPALFGPPKAQADAIKYARKQGCIVVVAAGNSNDDARRYSPANIKGVITVSAVDEGLNKASFSNTNTRLRMPIAAPGVNILSSVPGSEYMSYNGTSMATPIVSGLVGMLRAFDPEITTEEAYKILKETGTNVKDSDKVGHVINPLEALKAATK